MRLSSDPQTSNVSLLVVSLTFSLVFAQIFTFNTTRVAAQSSTEACSLPSFRQLDNKLNPPNLFSNNPITPSLACGDLNQDGLPDLVVAPMSASDVPLLTNLGNGAFRVGYFLDIPYRDVVVGDFNGDGHPDIVGLTAFDTVTTLLGDGTGSFFPFNASGEGQATPVGNYATALRAGDFNRDGKLDLAVVNSFSNTVAILPGKGNGNFLDAVNYDVQQYPHSLALGDFNGDGVLDIATANEYSETVTLLFNDGNGGFSASQIPAGALPQKVIAWDFNHDGIRDLAVVNRGYNSVTILRNDGSGNFTPAARWDLPFMSSSIAAGDFNRDGQEDLVVAHQYEGAVTLFLGDGNSGYCSQTRLQVAAASCCSVMDLCPADVNADGNLDLIVANESTVSVLLNNDFVAPNTAPTIQPRTGIVLAGGGSVSTEIATVSDAETPASSLQIEVTALPSGTTISNITNNNGTIRATLTIACGASVANHTVGLKVTDAGGLSANADLKILIAGNSRPVLGAYSDVTLDTGNTIVTPTSKPLDNGSITSLTVAAQGYSGQLIINSEGVVTITNNGVAGRYLAVVTATDNCDAVAVTGFYFTIASMPSVCNTISFKAAVNVDVGAAPQALATRDVNNDGLPDLVVAKRDSQSVAVWLGTNEGGVRSFRNAFSYEVGADPRAVAISDFDSDGNVDLAVVNRGADTITILHGNGDGSFATVSSYDSGSKPFSVAVGDFNSDGRPDLVVVNEGRGNLAILDGNGDGSFGAPRYFYAGITPQPAQVGDFNKDGKADIVVANFVTNEVTVLLGTGDGGFENARSYDAGTGWSPSPIALGDINKDGNIDLVIGKRGYSHVSVLFGFGNGSFGFYTAFVAGREPQSVIINDFDGDGNPDVAVGNFQDNSVTVFQGNGTGFYNTLQGQYYRVGAHPMSLLSGDFNGDGKLDLVIANTEASSISVLLNGCGER